MAQSSSRAMEEFIRQKNIEHFQLLLGATTDEAAKKILLDLLAQEEAKPAGLSALANGLDDSRSSPDGQAGLACLAEELGAFAFVEAILWPEGPICPRCGTRSRTGKLEGLATHLGTCECHVCRRTFSITHGTIFSGSDVPLHKWLQAIYLTNGGTIPVRPHHLARILNVSDTIAADMLRELEKAGLLSELLNSHLDNQGEAQRPAPEKRDDC